MMIALYAQTENTAMMVYYKVIVMLDISVILELLLGVIQINFVLLVITVPLVLYFQLLVQLHFTGQVQVLKTFHLVSLAKLAIIVLTTTMYLEYVQEAISVLKKLKNQYLALLVHIILIRDKEQHHCVYHAQQVQLA